MKNETNQTTGNTAAHDIDELSRQLVELRQDMAKLVETATGAASRTTNGLASEIKDGFSEAKHYAERKGKSAEAQVEDSVAAHPWLAIGLAVGTGLLVGALSRR